ncbi:hypothetical protein PP744_gp090 [Rhizobium phage RHph_N38]|uniref:Uncharacterized protein n=1 Tax=Rhizobium phage RHph_N38 TaxID=2509750 RepID=A0A7S5UWV0_9CAUD|nr:hypothetical protein PP744_gp090 [Rhizobium phage RHph_N38]QIG70553.1 hypothetical protein EVB89_090 [Rhizobium phage RHph_N38]
MDRNELETVLKDQAKAPRVTLDEVKDNISSIHYFTARQGVEGTYAGGIEDDAPIEDGAALSLLTFCVIVLKNGFTVTGESACASPENFDPAIGRKLAYERAFNDIWKLMGYHLKQKLHEAQQAQPPQETTGQDRLKCEAVELSAKIEKLRVAIENDTVGQGIDKTLLIQQKNVMLEYLEILTDRMMRAGLV